MKNNLQILGLAFGLATSNIIAGDTKTYQVTGPVLEVNNSYIVVQKGEDKWQIAHGKSAKKAAVNIGDKVTVQYQMVALEIEVKTDKAEKVIKAEKSNKAKSE